MLPDFKEIFTFVNDLTILFAKVLYIFVRCYTEFKIYYLILYLFKGSKYSICNLMMLIVIPQFDSDNLRNP